MGKRTRSIPDTRLKRETPIKILLVDDDALVRASIAQGLSFAGYEVLVSENGADALLIFEKEQPDISLIDINLPDLNGFSLLKTLRKTYPTAELIFITGEADMNLVIEALRQGISDFVPKPLSLNTLLTVLENAVIRIKQKNSPELSTITKPHETKKPDFPIHIRALGSLTLSIHGHVIQEKDWQNSKTAAVFKLLLINHKKVVPIDDIIEAVWKETSYRSAEVMVFTAISYIRRLFEPNLKNGRHSKFVLNHELGYELSLGTFEKDYYYDVEEFERLIRSARTNKSIQLYHDAVQLYADDFLKSNLLDDWSAYPRERLRDGYLSALQAICDDALEKKNYDAVIESARKMLSADSLYEPAYTLLVESYLALRRTADARRVLEQGKHHFKKLLNAPLPEHLAALLPSEKRKT